MLVWVCLYKCKWNGFVYTSQMMDHALARTESSQLDENRKVIFLMLQGKVKHVFMWHFFLMQEHFVGAMVEDHETGCWGCGLRLLLPSYSPIFKCGWCGAITTQNERKCETKYLWWRHARDRCFVCVLLGFMLFVICMSLFHFILPFPLSVCM